MINIIRADFYRIFNGKGIYITVILFLLLCYATSIGEQVYIGVAVEDLDVEEDSLSRAGTLNQEEEVETKNKLGRDIPFVVSRTHDNSLYFYLALLFFVIGADFSAGTVKNTLASGVSRLKYYLAKGIELFTLVLVFMLLEYIVPTLFTTSLYGFGEPFDGQYFTDVMTIFGVQLLYSIAVVSCGLFFALWTKKTAVINSLYLSLCLIPIIAIMILSAYDVNLLELSKYEMITNIRMSANLLELPSEDVLRMILVGVTYLAMSIVGSVLVFRRTEIK